MSGAGDTPEQKALIGGLKAKITELTAENRRLREIIKPVAMVPSAVGLTKTEQQLVIFLAERSPHVTTYACIRQAIYGRRATEMTDEIIKVFAAKVRPKLAPFGVKIETHWGFGYTMSAESARALRILMEVS